MNVWTLAETETAPATRVILGLAATVPLIGFWELVVRPWPAALSPLGLPLLIMGLVALWIGLLLAGAAILAPRVSVIVDEDGRRILRQWHTRRAGPLQRATPFATLAEVVVETDEGDSETTPAVRLRVLRKGGRSPVTLLTRPLSALPEVTALANRLRGALQP